MDQPLTIRINTVVNLSDEDIARHTGRWTFGPEGLTTAQREDVARKVLRDGSVSSRAASERDLAVRINIYIDPKDDFTLSQLPAQKAAAIKTFVSESLEETWCHTSKRMVQRLPRYRYEQIMEVLEDGWDPRSDSVCELSHKVPQTYHYV
jgi:hypothetical protein